MKVFLLFSLGVFLLIAAILLGCVAYLLLDEVREVWTQNKRTKMLRRKIDEFCEVPNDKNSL